MRRRQFGSVRQKASGKWQARYKDDTGQEHYRIFTTKKEAAAFLAATEADMLRGDWADPRLGQVTVEEWAATWLAGKHNLRKNTTELYAGLLRNHVLPAFGKRTLASIRPEHVEAWVAVLLANEDLSSSTANRAYRVFSQMMTLAVRRRRIPASPCADVAAPKDAQGEMLFLTVKQVAALADAIDKHYRALVLMAVYSGLRWGELAGLKVSRLDVINRTVTVTHQLTKTGELAPPKSEAGVRTVALPEWLMQIMRKHIADKAMDDYVFTFTEGGPMAHTSNFTRRVWKPAVKKALPPALHALRFHDLRHTAVALAIDHSRKAGKPLNAKALQVRMGHSTIKMTLDRYGHLLPGHDDDIAASLTDPFADDTDTNVVALGG